MASKLRGPVCNFFISQKLRAFYHYLNDDSYIMNSRDIDCYLVISYNQTCQNGYIK